VKLQTETLLILGAAGAVLLLLAYLTPKVGQVAGGIISGDNALTQGATNSQGEKVTAYLGAGFAGTAGAAANEASGGTLASLGEWLGGKAYDLTHP